MRDILYGPRCTRYGRHMEGLVEISDQLDLRCRCIQLLGPFIRPCQKRRLHEEVIQGAKARGARKVALHFMPHWDILIRAFGAFDFDCSTCILVHRDASPGPYRCCL